MLSPLALATVCLASSTVWAAYVKPNYNVDNAENLFKDFIKNHNKIYEQAEYSERLAIFKENLNDINKRNEMFPDTVFELTYFADLKPNEIQQYNNFKLPNKTLTEMEMPDALTAAAHDVFDWRDHNAVSPVKNQGKCGASYIFSAVANIEGQYAIKHHQCLSFSEGQALDCLDYGSCQEGDIASIMRELAQKKKKLEKADDYPYVPAKRPCTEDASKGIVTVTSGDDMILYDEDKIKSKLVNYGPLSIAYHSSMLSPLALATVCLASSTVWAAYVKPNYNVDNAENLFKDFIKNHNKIYEQAEYSERLAIFKETLNDINKRNEMFPDTVFELTYFADLKPNELQQYNNFKLPNKTLTEMEMPEALTAAAHDVFDWRDHNAVSPVKNQGKCGASYIFSAVANIEGQYAIKHHQCLSFSEGQALDCLDYGSCQEGDIASIMRELAQKKKKLEKADDYPYVPAKRPCTEDASKGIVTVTSGDDMILFDEEKIKSKLVNYGPLSIALDASDLLNYKAGILSPNKCSTGLNLGVLLVGYGEENGVKFWIIKNSWGTGWGEEGYVRLLRGVNACGLGHYIAVSTVL